MSKQDAVLVANTTMNDPTTATSREQADGKTLSAFLPPPPIFKPRFVHMQRSSSISDSPPTPSPKTGSTAAVASTPFGSQNSTMASTPFSSFESLNNLKAQNTGTSTTAAAAATAGKTNNSNFLTSSFVSNEEYRNHFLSHSPSISPMTRYTDMPLPDDDASSTGNNTGSNNKLNPNQPIRQAKKRRRSSAYNKEEIERKKKELKTQHSIIEKRRRIKMNREFEALKFLVPACRLNILTGLNDGNFDNSNMMHKLTILQSTVEYIKYLHLIIKLMKLQMLIPKDTRDTFKAWIQKNDNLNFVDFDLDLQAYRDIESEFNFENIFLKVWENEGSIPNDWLDPITKEIMKVLSPSERSKLETDAKTSGETKEAAISGTKSKRSQSHPNIHTPSTILEERIQENSEYRNSILKLQQDSSSFKLPLPAIIDKHPDLGLLNSAPSAGANSVSYDNKLPSPSSSSYTTAANPTAASTPVFRSDAAVNSSPLSGSHFPAAPAYRMGSGSNPSTTTTTTSPLKNVLPFPIVNNSNRQFGSSSMTPRHQFSSMPSDYSLNNSRGGNTFGSSAVRPPTLDTRQGITAGSGRIEVLPGQLSRSPDMSSSASSASSASASVSVSPERKDSGADATSPEIQAASRLLIEIKSSKRHPSIQDILN